MLTGSCLCGGVRYRAAGPVADASHCYCTMCQKQHGAVERELYAEHKPAWLPLR